MLKAQLVDRSAKLRRYTEVVKTFDSQIRMFDEFQKSSLEEMEKLKSQVRLFQDLFQKEKTDNCEMARQLQVFQSQTYQQRSHDLSRDMDRGWESKAFAFDSRQGSLPVVDSIGTNNAGGLNDQRKSTEPAKLAQTLSKNLSFGQVLFNSHQSSKNRDHNASQERRNPHLLDLPLQILSETSSDDHKYTGEKFRAYTRGKQCEAFED